jgi:hypothetical protein
LPPLGTLVVVVTVVTVVATPGVVVAGGVVVALVAGPVLVVWSPDGFC